jgi:hypothetical protein
MDPRPLLRYLGVATRLAWRVRRRGKAPPPDDAVAWRDAMRRWIDTLPAGTVADHAFVDIPANRPPWLDTGLEVRAGDTVTWFATGRVYLSRALDVWVDPSFQLWARVGDRGTILRGTRATHTFVAAADGTLQLASYFPGEWATPDGQLGHGADGYGQVTGGMTAAVVRWSRGVDPARAMAGPADAPRPVRDEVQRLGEPSGPPPGWEYLWYLGPGEIYRPGRADDGSPSICCATHGDVGILRREARVPLDTGLRLDWRWRVDRLPADLREDSLPSHDYLSLAVEFDDGQDLTYYWSAALPVGTVYRCPLPTWRDKETHLVVRSGTAGLGRWQDESRDLAADYRRCIGGNARSVVRVWLIANSLFLRGHGQCEYAGIAIHPPGGDRVAVL